MSGNALEYSYMNGVKESIGFKVIQPITSKEMGVRDEYQNKRY